MPNYTKQTQNKEILRWSSWPNCEISEAKKYLPAQFINSIRLKGIENFVLESTEICLKLGFFFFLKNTIFCLVSEEILRNLHAKYMTKRMQRNLDKQIWSSCLWFFRFLLLFCVGFKKLKANYLPWSFSLAPKISGKPKQEVFLCDFQIISLLFQYTEKCLFHSLWHSLLVCANFLATPSDGYTHREYLVFLIHQSFE